MANANALAVCPRCGVELPGPTPPVCPNKVCRHIFKVPTNKHFKDPDYLDRQMRRWRDSFARRETGFRPPDEVSEEYLILSSYSQWAEDAPMASRLAAFRDAFHLLRHVVHSDMSEADFIKELRELTSLGKTIGKLSESLENYFKCGGSSSDDEYRRALQQEAAALAQVRGIP